MPNKNIHSILKSRALRVSSERVMLVLAELPVDTGAIHLTISRKLPASVKAKTNLTCAQEARICVASRSIWLYNLAVKSLYGGRDDGDEDQSAGESLGGSDPTD